jgi:hypothetical protein
MAKANKVKAEVIDKLNGKTYKSIAVPEGIDPEVIKEHIDELQDVFSKKQGQIGKDGVNHVKVPVGKGEHSVGLALTGRNNEIVIRDYTAEANSKVRGEVEYNGITYPIQDMRLTSTYTLDMNDAGDAEKVKQMIKNKVNIDHAKETEGYKRYVANPVRIDDVNPYTGQAFKRTVLIRQNEKTGSWYFDKGRAPKGLQKNIEGVRVSSKVEKGNAFLTKKSFDELVKNPGKEMEVEVLGADGELSKEYIAIKEGKDKQGNKTFKAVVGNPGVDVKFGHAYSRFSDGKAQKNVDFDTLKDAIENLQPVKFGDKTFVYVVSPKADREGNISLEADDIQLRRCQYPSEMFDTAIENLTRFEEEVGAKEAAKIDLIANWRKEVAPGTDPFAGKEVVDLGGPRPFVAESAKSADAKTPKKETAKKATKKAPAKDEFVETSYGEVSTKYGRSDYVTKEQAEELLANGGTVERTTQAGKTQAYRFAPMIKYDLDRESGIATPKAGAKPYIGLTTENGVGYAAQALQIAFDDPTGCGFEPKDISEGFKKLVNEIGDEDLKKSLETFAGVEAKKPEPKKNGAKNKASKTGKKVNDKTEEKVADTEASK